MAKSVPFDVDAYTKRLQSFAPSIQEAEKESLDFYSDQAVALVKRNVPQDHGELVDTVRKEEGRGPLSVDVSVGGQGTDYAAHVEFGHRDGDEQVPPHPFFYPAMRLTKKKYRNGMTAKVRKAMRAVCKEADGE